MNNESAWEKFKKSGHVLDYLSYRSEPNPIPDNMWEEDSLYAGAKHENICKWSNYPRNGLR